MNKLPIVSVALKNIATLGFVGFLPIAPGTWGSLCGMVFLLVFPISWPVHLLFIAGGFVIGVKASAVAEVIIGQHDSGHIIIDEFVGFLVAAFYMPHTVRYLLAAFLLFRVFDILKPFPVNRVEKAFRGGFGIMADDIAAGLYANMIIHLWIAI